MTLVDIIKKFNVSMAVKQGVQNGFDVLGEWQELYVNIGWQVGCPKWFWSTWGETRAYVNSFQLNPVENLTFRDPWNGKTKVR